ncbi:hypothetical protein [Paraclostridium dentum]|uniref:hypothetical protein n=1 Tax=Paraclostridium dentum TaxID=2662455 RepID=UPI003F353709
MTEDDIKLEGLSDKSINKHNKLINKYKDINAGDLTAEELESVRKANKALEKNDIFKAMDNKNITIGQDKAEEVYNARLALKASDFNESSQNDRAVSQLMKQGFEKRHISDIEFDAEDIATRNLLVDLGEEFGTNRYIAIPGTGSKVGDEDILSAHQSKLRSLKRSFEEFDSLGGINNEKSTKAMANVLNKRDEAMMSLDSTLFGKNALLHEMSKVTIDMPAFRNKASGVVTDTSNASLKQIAESNGWNIVNNGSGLTDRAHIGGKSISEWESKGVYHDYAFVSREQMKNMGYFDESRLKQFNFKTEDEMAEFLSKHGTYGITDRYPNTRTGSLNSVRMFLDENLQGNQIKMSIPTMLKANADHDGDSYSTMLLQNRVNGNLEDGALYERAISLAKEKVGDNATFDEIRNQALKDKHISEQMFDEFSNMSAGMHLIAAKDNQK